MKLASLIGLLTGLLHGMVDVIARIVVPRFDWYELYQALSISAVIYVSIFLGIAIFVELLRRFIQPVDKRATRDWLSLFYISIGFLGLLVFFCWYAVDVFILPSDPSTSKEVFRTSAMLILISGSLYFIILARLKEQVLKIFNSTMMQKLIENFLFAMVVFIGVSAMLDISILGQAPQYTPPEELKDQPNVIILLIDTLRADHMSVYGYHRDTTPEIKKFAENSVVFENTISQSPWTIPSISSLFTGKIPTHHTATIKHQKLEANQTTLADILTAEGYNTVGFASGMNLKERFGLSQGFIGYSERLDFIEMVGILERGSVKYWFFKLFPRFDKSIEKLFQIDRYKSSEEINEEVYRWLDLNKDNSPFFMFVHYYDPHEWINPAAYERWTPQLGKFTDVRMDFWEFKDNIPEYRFELDVPADTVQYAVDLYDTTIVNQDRSIGDMLDRLESLGLLDNSIVIVTGDHGEEFYEHNAFGHVDSVYEEQLHVPLIVHYPKEFEPRRVEERVWLSDLFPTILDIYGISLPDDIDSKTLYPVLTGEGEYTEEYTFSEVHAPAGWNNTGEQYTVTKDGWKLIEVVEPAIGIESSVFNLEEDSEEQNNLYDVEVDKKKELQALLTSVISDPRLPK